MILVALMAAQLNELAPLNDRERSQKKIPRSREELAMTESLENNGEAAPQQITPQTMYHNPGKSRKGKGPAPQALQARGFPSVSLPEAYNFWGRHFKSSESIFHC